MDCSTPEKGKYQLIIIGGGPAGLTAGLFAARAKVNTLLLEKLAAGGQVLNTEKIDNYPGFPEGITGFELAEKLEAQAKRFGLQTMTDEVASLEICCPVKKVHLASGKTLTCQGVIIATGSRPNQLNVDGEETFAGKGVSYCAICDGPFYRNMEIAVVGGGDSALQEAVHLTRFASKVTIIHRRDTLRATKILQEMAFANDKIEFIYDTQVTAIKGNDFVESLQLRHKSGRQQSLAVQGLFVLIGSRPNNEMLPHHRLEMEDGFVVTDKLMNTNIPGVYAAGDICSKPFRQIVNAVGEAAVAALSAEHYIFHT